jgi:hypothetical protein
MQVNGCFLDLPSLLGKMLFNFWVELRVDIYDNTFLNLGANSADFCVQFICVDIP